MREQKSPFRVLTESGQLVALAVGVAHLVGVAGPASAQFFNFGGWSQPQPQPRGGSGWFGGDVYAPFQRQVPRYQAPRRQAPRQILEDFSKAPPLEKRETVPEHNVLVLGDGMADWLAYGLEDAYAERPDMGVIRRQKTVSGLIKYQPKGDPADWAAAAKGLLATEKPDASRPAVRLALSLAALLTESPGSLRTASAAGRIGSIIQPIAPALNFSRSLRPTTSFWQLLHITSSPLILPQGGGPMNHHTNRNGSARQVGRSQDLTSQSR
jgi:hypothetical protein